LTRPQRVCHKQYTYVSESYEQHSHHARSGHLQIQPEHVSSLVHRTFTLVMQPREVGGMRAIARVAVGKPRSSCDRSHSARLYRSTTISPSRLLALHEARMAPLGRWHLASARPDRCASPRAVLVAQKQYQACPPRSLVLGAVAVVRVPIKISTVMVAG